MEHQLRHRGQSAVAAAARWRRPRCTGTEDGGGAQAVDIFNTTSWPRTGLAVVPQEISGGGNFLVNDQGQSLSTQRIAGGDLAVLVSDLPPFSGRRFTLSREAKPAPLTEDLKVGPDTLANSRLSLRVDPVTGAIVELRAAGIDANLADTADGHAINDYLYLLGDNPSAARRNGPVRITVRDRGPLVATLRIESAAPGCYRLVRDLRLVASSDHVELLDTVDKQRLDASNYYANDGKESVNIAFPFNVPGGELRLDIPFGVDAAGRRPDAQRVQELVQRGAMGRGGQRRLRHHLGHPRRPSRAGGRDHGDAAQLADESRGVAQEGGAHAEVVRLGDERPI